MAKAAIAAIAKKAIAGAIVAGVGIVGVVASSSQPVSPIKGIVNSVSGGQPTGAVAVYVPPTIAKPPVVVPVAPQGASAVGTVIKVSGGQPTSAQTVKAAPPASAGGSNPCASSGMSQSEYDAAMAHANDQAMQVAKAEAAAGHFQADGKAYGGAAFQIPAGAACAPPVDPCNTASGGSGTSQAGYDAAMAHANDQAMQVAKAEAAAGHFQADGKAYGGAGFVVGGGSGAACPPPCSSSSSGNTGSSGSGMSSADYNAAMAHANDQAMQVAKAEAAAGHFQADGKAYGGAGFVVGNGGTSGSSSNACDPCAASASNSSSAGMSSADYNAAMAHANDQAMQVAKAEAAAGHFQADGKAYGGAGFVVSGGQSSSTATSSACSPRNGDDGRGNQGDDGRGHVSPPAYGAQAGMSM